MSRRYVSIWLPNIATDWFVLRKPFLQNTPFILAAPSHGKMIITAANLQAQQRGIATGMAVADARALLPALQVFDDMPKLVPQLLQRMAEWCIRFTPAAAVDLWSGEQGRQLCGIILDATGCSHLWGSEEAYVTDILKRLKAKGYFARAAMADTIGTAWAEARYGRALVIEKGQHTEQILKFPPEALRIETETTERLRKLGLLQIKDFIAMPRKALRRRFGALIIERLNQAIGTAEEFIQPVYPPEAFGERLPCLEPIMRIEGIEIALKTLLDALCSRLQKEGKGLRHAFFRCYRTDGNTVGITINTNRPSHHVKHLFYLFGLKLSTLEPGPGIELFVLEATHVEEQQAAQEAFWKETAGLHDDSVAQLLDRLAARIGDQSIHRFLPAEHWWPERSFKKASDMNEEAITNWNLDRPRPLYLLSPPESLEVTAPIPDYPPMLFRYKNKLHKITRADGPERIEQEWWIEEGMHRDYYAVEDEDGCRYWIFRLGHYNEIEKARWFLHGFFA